MSAAAAMANGTTTEAPNVLSVQQILSAPPDCREEVIEVPGWGGSVRLRSPTALAAAEIKSAMIVMDAEGKTVAMDVAASERKQFQLGVVEPVFTEAQVVEVQAKFGPAWQHVISALDRISGPLGKPKAGDPDPEGTFPTQG